LPQEVRMLLMTRKARRGQESEDDGVFKRGAPLF